MATYFNFKGGSYSTSDGDLVRFLLSLIDGDGRVWSISDAVTHGIAEYVYAGDPKQPSWIPANGRVFSTEAKAMLLVVNEAGRSCDNVNYPFFINIGEGVIHRLITIHPRSIRAVQAGYHFRVAGRFMRLSEVKDMIGGHFYTRMLMCAKLPPKRILKAMIAFRDLDTRRKRVPRKLRVHR